MGGVSWRLAFRFVRQFTTKPPEISEARTISSAPIYLKNKADMPEAPAPEECCGRGCSNCVWITYADRLMDFFRDEGAQRAREMIESKVKDTNLRTYLLMELKGK